MKPTRVLQFITPTGFYGAERWVLALANNLSGENVVCDLAVTDEGTGQDLSVADAYPLHLGQVHRISLKHRFDVSAVGRLCDVIKQRKIELIHTHGYKSDILGVMAARRCNIKAISTPHGFAANVDFKLRLFIKAGVFSYRFFDQVVPLSQDLVNDMERFKVPKSKTTYIANGVDLTELDAFLQSPSENTDSLHFGYVGQLIPRKGLIDMIKAFQMVWKEYPNARLTLVGDGNQRRELEELAESLPCRENIKFLGFQSERLQIMKDFDVFLMTSTLEGIPRCMMEAMAMGIPVIAYDIPGVDQLVAHESTGMLAPLGDIDRFADLCRQLARDTQRRRDLSNQARTLIEEKFSAARMAEEYTVLFNSLLSSGGSENGRLQKKAG